MSQLPASLDGGLEKLSAAGYDLASDSGYLLVRVPYLDFAGNLQQGVLADPLNYVNESTVGPCASHQVYFVGSRPCQIDGSPVTMLGGTEGRTVLPGNRYSSFHFSMKLMDSETNQMRPYKDLFEKIVTYASVIGGPAAELYPQAEVAPLKVSESEASPFVYVDAMSSHAELGELNEVFRAQSVAIIGGGGTGSYVLDFLAKSPVPIIKVFDDDDYNLKNSYRSPGVPDPGEFGRPKAEILAERYSRFHKGVTGVRARITASSGALLHGFTFAFVCVDRGESRLEIAALLRSLNIPFVDTGLGLDRVDGSLKGMIRTTFVDQQSQERILRDETLPSKDAGEELYSTNIQICELNALNAALAILRFKKYLKFYKDDAPDYNVLFVPNRMAIFKQEIE